MKKALVDVAVLLVFFTRHEQFEKVFQQVRKARPSELFLYQDGPRENNYEDVINIKKCREIAENIDWECKVHRLYQEHNVGCDPSGYIAHTWAFSKTDKCIVLEDDDLPALSFFEFCKELLDRYENDERVMLITGLNTDGITEYCPYDYFFTSTTFTAGCWASWGRVVSKWDSNYGYLEDVYYKELIEDLIRVHKYSEGFLPSCKEHKSSGKAHFETILISNQYLNSGLTIVPKKNMVLNIGLTGEATHTDISLECLPKGYRKLFELDIHEMLCPLKAPRYVLEDCSYKRRAYRVYGWGNYWIKIGRSLETLWYMILHGKTKNIIKYIKEKVQNVRKGRIS